MSDDDDLDKRSTVVIRAYSMGEDLRTEEVDMRNVDLGLGIEERKRQEIAEMGVCKASVRWPPQVVEGGVIGKKVKLFDKLRCREAVLDPNCH